MPGQRVSTRLIEYDYRYGAFFISLVTENRAPLFGKIINKKVQLYAAGRIVADEWLRTTEIRPSVQLDEWIVMPDHFQAIAFIDNGNGDRDGIGNVGGASWRPCPLSGESTTDNGERIRSIQPGQRSLARVVNQFKATTARRINEIRQTPGQSVWQRGYHDRIIRSDIELDNVRNYIRTNPERG